MINKYLLRAKWTLKTRPKPVVPNPIPHIAPRGDDIVVKLAPYTMAMWHIAGCWEKGKIEEFEWYIKAMRGLLPPDPRSSGPAIKYIFLSGKEYYRALEVITTRLGVKPADAVPR